MRAFILAVCLLFGVTSLAAAQSATIEVTGAWARATAGKAPGGAFMTITNKGAGADRLVGASTSAAESAELHVTKNVDGVMKMTPVPVLEIKPGQSVKLAPGGYHIMLMGLKAPLKQGASFPLALTFEKAGTVEVTVKVGKPGAMSSVPTGMNMN